MGSFRRYYVDKYLNEYQYLMKGRVIDIGGRKNIQKGNFIPNLKNCLEWKFLNNDPSTNPDYLSDASSIPVENSYFDLAIMIEVLEYIYDPIQSLKEVHRVLKTNSKLIITVPLIHPIHADHAKDHYRFTKTALYKLAKNSGFEVHKIIQMGSTLTVIYDIFRISFFYSSKNKIKDKIFLRLIEFFFPLIKMIDNFCNFENDYIHTGYFLILSKK